ncbi:hypothetical protein E4H12_02380 [Candidatus Thorarchaeota archaeon]|nr:hypothetical protein [Candidatus Thorarchaeota archaeon]TFG99529.1 MAG: hypothetical protein E4H12_02380 [Candidatus Thorarchaeota archaeon]
MSKIIGVNLTFLFGFLAVLTSTFLWNVFNFPAILQTVVILLIAAIGEHLVSGKGYYHYTNMNGIFVGRVPAWIPLMWVAAIQGTLILPLMLGVGSTVAIALSGIICATLDLYFIEPLLSRKLGMWRWTSVERGYFSFVPSQVNRFTAPFGNYLTWLIFPIAMNAFLSYMTLLQILP